jgi:hypothetical protein
VKSNFGFSLGMRLTGFVGIRFDSGEFCPKSAALHEAQHGRERQHRHAARERANGHRWIRVCFHNHRQSMERHGGRQLGLTFRAER